MPPDLKESNLGEILADMPEHDERRSLGLKYLKQGLKMTNNELPVNEDEDEDEDEPVAQGYRVMVVKNKNQRNPKNFLFEVVDPQGKQNSIKRNLTDMIWLRENLRKDFPYSYVYNLDTTHN